MLAKDIETTRTMPLMELPLRTSVFALDGARVLLGPASTLTREQLVALGPVDVVVAPNLLHVEGCTLAAEVFPDAKLWGPDGVRTKAPALRWEGILGVDAWPYATELEALPIAGMPRMNETVFLDRASGTLHVADLVFNMTAGGLGAKIILSLFGTRDRFAVSRLFMTQVKDRAAFRASIESLLTREFDRIAPCHGAVVAAGAKEKLRNALAERGCAPGKNGE